VVASNGGVVGARQAAERPVFVVGSGPAAGGPRHRRGAPSRGARRAEPDRLRHGRHHYKFAPPLQIRYELALSAALVALGVAYVMMA